MIDISAVMPTAEHGMPPAEKGRGGTVYRDVPYASIPGYRSLLLDLTVPPGKGPFPVVVWIHGGAWIVGSNKPNSPTDAAALIRDQLLDAGVAVAAVQYRFSSESIWPAQLHDVKAAVRWVRSNAEDLGLDPGRIGAWGASAGGHLAALLAVTGDRAELEGEIGPMGTSSEVKACIDWYGIADIARMQSQAHLETPWNHDAPDAPGSLLLGGPVQTVLDRAAAASPITYVSQRSAPILLVHGEEDRLVAIQQSISLAGRYRLAGATAELVTVPGADHGFAGVDVRPLVGSGVAWMTRHLASST